MFDFFIMYDLIYLFEIHLNNGFFRSFNTVEYWKAFIIALDSAQIKQAITKGWLCHPPLQKCNCLEIQGHIVQIGYESSFLKDWIKESSNDWYTDEIMDDFFARGGELYWGYTALKSPESHPIASLIDYDTEKANYVRRKAARQRQAQG